MGNDVAGRREGGECPHIPGDCLRNEELLLGQCYMKCAVLTENEYTFRTGPDTCCKYQTKFACLDPLNTMVSANFSVGGAVHDSIYSAKFGASHTPIPALAEEQTTTTLPSAPPVVTLPGPVTP